MKKAIAIALIVVMSALTLSAAGFDFSEPTYFTLASPFTKTSARISAMGGAGLAVFNNQDSLYINPASLGGKGLVFNLPNAAVTLYNVKDLVVESGLLEQVIEDPSVIAEDPMGYIGKILDPVLRPGNTKLATVDAGIGFKAGRFAFAIDSQVNLNIANPSAGISQLQIVPQVDLAATMGLGFRFFRDKAFNLDIGVSAALQVRAFMEKVSWSDLNDELMQDPMAYLDKKPIAIGWAVPLTVGVNINMPFGFTIANVVSNIQLVNGGYNYVVQESYNDFVDDPMGTVSGIFTNDTVYTAKSDFIYSAGIGWSPDLGGWEWLIDPTIAVDVVDIVGLVQDPSLNTFLYRLKAGAEIQLFKFLELRGGLNSGYATLGAGINLFNVIHLEASYYWNEFGQQLGAQPVDALTIRVNIGWER